MDDERILLIRTGGTIDAEPYGEGYTLETPPDPVTPFIGDDSLVLQNAREFPHVDAYHYGEWAENHFIRDSKDFDEDDMKELASVVQADNHTCVAISHGTNFMARNARRFKKALQDNGKRVAFFGAMVPLSMDGTYLPSRHRNIPSDGIETMHFVFDHLYEQPPGVYVVGHDADGELKFFDPEEVDKNVPSSFAELSLRFKDRDGQAR